MVTAFKRWIQDITAATAIEYVLIGAAVAIAISATVFLLGDHVLALFLTVADSLS